MVEHSLGKGEVISSILIIGSSDLVKAAVEALRILWWAVGSVYVILAILGSIRLRGKAGKLNHVVMILMAVLLWVKFWIHHAFGGQSYQYAVVVVGIAAGVAALVVAKLLMTQRADGEDETGGAERSEEQAQS